MGTVIRFRPMVRPARLRSLGTRSESATMIILPVVRIERFSDAPTSGLEPATGSGRRRLAGGARADLKLLRAAARCGQ